jgi:hypothetical protein
MNATHFPFEFIFFIKIFKGSLNSNFRVLHRRSVHGRSKHEDFPWHLGEEEKVGTMLTRVAKFGRR